MSASEKQLADLHAQLARVMATALEGTPVEGYEDPETGEYVEGTTIPPSASVMTVVAKFLKDNEITCRPDEDNELGELQRLMEERQRKLRGLDSIDRAQIADDLGFAAGSA